MSTVLMFHHALGLTDGMKAFADDLRAGGHHVLAPDLYDGATFGDIDDGVAHANSIGFENVLDSGVSAAHSVPGPFSVVGFSLGVMPAQKLAQTDPDVTRAVLCHAAVPLEAFENPWPSGLPVQIHMTPGDPWADEDMDAARELARLPRAELHLYPGTGHLLADISSGDYDATLAGLLTQRVLRFLERTW